MSYLQLKQTNQHKKNWICRCGRKNDNDDLKCAFCREPKPEKVAKQYVCNECGNSFTPTNHGRLFKFCSNSCSAKYQWKHRVIKPKKFEVKKCDSCGVDFVRNGKFSQKQWDNTRFCSSACMGRAKTIMDGLTGNQRARLRRGAPVFGSQEWKDLISKRTSEGMQAPEVQAKIRTPRRPMADHVKQQKSNALAGKMPKNMLSRGGAGTGSFPNVQRGDYETSKGTVYFRSKWEANYALYLDFLIKIGDILDWEYEAEVFFFEEIRIGQRSYRPDFKVKKLDETFEYHEVKGYMDAKSKTKINRMEKFFPNITMVLIQADDYRNLLKKMKGIVHFYK